MTGGLSSPVRDNADEFVSAHRPALRGSKWLEAVEFDELGELEH